MGSSSLLLVVWSSPDPICLLQNNSIQNNLFVNGLFSNFQNYSHLPKASSVFCHFRPPQKKKVSHALQHKSVGDRVFHVAGLSWAKFDWMGASHPFTAAAKPMPHPGFYCRPSCNLFSKRSISAFSSSVSRAETNASV